jgi:hypothetical protein
VSRFTLRHQLLLLLCCAASPAGAPPSKTSSFKKEQNISLSITRPNDVPVPGEEVPVVEPLMTPSAAEVEATLDKELQQLQQGPAEANGKSH